MKARYCVLYGRDAYGRAVPISCEPLKESVLSTLDYRKAVQFSDMENGNFLKKQAELIEQLRLENGKKAVVPPVVPPIPAEVREEPRAADKKEIRKESSEAIREETVTTAETERMTEAEDVREEREESNKKKPKVGPGLVALVLVAGVVIGVAIVATSKFNASQKDTPLPEAPQQSTWSDGGYSEQNPGQGPFVPFASSVGLAFEPNGDGTCTLVGIGTCTDTDIVIPSEYEGMRVTRIGDSAFIYNENLTSVTIPYGITKIGDSVFSECTSLQEIHYENTIGKWNNIVLGGSWNADTGNYTIYCSDGTIAKNG